MKQSKQKDITYRDKLIELLQENTQESCELFYYIMASEDSPVIRALRGYTSSAQAAHRVINEKIHDNLELFSPNKHEQEEVI